MNLTHINGILAIIFGLIAILLPSITIAGLSIYFAFTLIVGGLALILSSRRISMAGPYIRTLRLEGLIGVLVGVVVLLRPVSAAKLLAIIIGVWALVMGIILLISYFRRQHSEEWNIVSLIGGVLSFLFGLIIIINPFESIRFITILIGIYVVAYGIVSLVHATRLHTSRYNNVEQ